MTEAQPVTITDVTAPPSLDYAQRASAEGFVVQRRPGGAVVIAVPTPRRILRPVWGFTVFVAIAGLIAGGITYSYRNLALPVGALVWPGLLLLAGAYHLLSQLVPVFHGIRWEVDEATIEVVVRRLTGVVRHGWPRDAVADVLVQRVQLPGQSWKTRHVVLATAAGHKLAIAGGSRRELEALCAVLREILGLPPDPADESSYPQRPRGARAQRHATPGGVWMTLHPTVVPWRWVAVLGPVLFAGALAVEHFATFTSPTGSWTPTEARAWAVVRVSMMTLVPLILLCIGLYRLRRTTIVGVQNGSLMLVEKGLVRPCHVAWPLAEITSVDVADATRRGRSRAALAVTLNTGELVRALDGERRREVEWMTSSLRHAMARAAAPASHADLLNENTKR
jgi:hypothetical protein